MTLLPSLPATPSRGLSIGITEPNANFLWSPAERSAVAPGFGRWRDALDAIDPGIYRMLINWAQVQPDPSRPPDWDVPDSGCLRGLAPCGPYDGIREQLEAIRSRQRHGGLDVLVVFNAAPAWASPQTPSGCELTPTPPGARGVAPQAIGAYAALARSLLALAAHEGVALRFWSAWNEPNTPQFISPQRASCSAASPSLAPARYATLVRALEPILRAAPGDDQLVLGETAAYGAASALKTGVQEFVADLPHDVVCAAEVWAQHLYISPATSLEQGAALAVARDAGRLDAAGSVAFLRQIHAALAARGCGRPYSIWVTETGVGGPVAGRPRQADPASERAGCRELAAALSGWNQLGYVGAAIQYTFREDDLYPVGLLNPTMTATYPAYDLWRAWGRRAPGDPAPPLPSSCGG